MESNCSVSPTLSKLELRIKDLNDTRRTIESCECDLLRYRNQMEIIECQLAELSYNEEFCIDRIKNLIAEASKEGFDDKYIERFLKEHKCKIDSKLYE